jgi:hypothetical protein
MPIQLLPDKKTSDTTGQIIESTIKRIDWNLRTPPFMADSIILDQTNYDALQEPYGLV